MSQQTLKPSDLIGVEWDRFYGCTELENTLHEAIAYLADHGDQWDLPIPRPSPGDHQTAWNWDHEHPRFDPDLNDYGSGDVCQFHVRVLDVCGVIKASELKRMFEHVSRR